MACIHNQAEINRLTAEINEKQKQITSLNNNITKCTDIKSKHKSFSDKLQCVISNLEGNTVVSGQTYDGGKMQVCQDDANKTIRDCEEIISQSQIQIRVLENIIRRLESRIASLQGNCSSCSKAMKNGRWK